MTISTEETRKEYNCDGSTQSFAYDLPYYDKDHVVVVLVQISNQAETVLVLDTDYTLTSPSMDGGTISTVLQYSSAYRLVIYLDVEYKQETDLVEGGALPADAVEKQFDLIVQMVQQISERIGRAPLLPVASLLSDLNLPIPASNAYLGWNSAGDGFENKTPSSSTLALSTFGEALVQLTQKTYFVDPTVTDQGSVTAEGNRSIADLVALAGSNLVKLVLPHSGSGATTSFAFDTNYSLATKPNVFIDPEPGAVFSRVTGDEIFTVYSPGNLLVAQYQQFTSVDMIRFSIGGVVCPHGWGAKEGTACSSAFQYCINSIAACGGVIKPLPGIYTAYDLETYGGIRWEGPGWEYCEIKETAGVDFVLSVNKGTGGTTDPADNEMNIEISGIHFSGPVSTAGFQEHVHVLNINAVSHFRLHDCKISGYCCDGVYIGSSNDGATERHNIDVTIDHCFFDGVNSDNRQAISIIDCRTARIHHNYIVNTTRSTMPGAIDIEPNSNTFHIIRDIIVEFNTIEGCGGNVAGICLVLGSTNFTNQPQGFIFRYNRFNGTSCNGFYVSNSVNYTLDLDIQIVGNHGNVIKPWGLYGTYIKGIKISFNSFHFTDSPGSIYATDKIIRGRITNNNLLGDGSTKGYVIQSCDDLVLAHNTITATTDYSILIGGASGAVVNSLNIHDGYLGGAVAIEFGAATFTYVKIHDVDLSGATIKIEGTIPANARILNNRGYNPVGLSSISVGASPFTYTAGASPETVYVHGGTVSDIAKSSITIAVASPAQIELGPSESITVTYSSTPTMVKDVH